MQTKNEQKTQSIFQYVKENIDEDGYFIGNTLPHNNPAFISGSISFDLGAADAFYVMSPGQDDPQVVSYLETAIKQYLDDPTDKNQENLYNFITRTQCISYTASLIDNLNNRKSLTHLLELAEHWFYYATDREAVKFAILLFGLSDLKNIDQAKYPSLLTDLNLLARCDEFTYFVLLALNLSNLKTEDTVWDIIKHTFGWGRVHALLSADFSTAEQKNWLLHHGCEIDVHFPPIAVLCITKSNLYEILQQPTIDKPHFFALSNIMVTYLDFLLDYDPVSLFPPKDYPKIDNFILLKNFIRLAAPYQNDIENLYDIITLTSHLHEITTNNRWEILDANSAHILISMAESLLYSQDWLPQIKQELINKKGKINYTVIDFARELEIDIWDLLFSILEENPTYTKLFSYLLADPEPARFHKALAFAEQHLEAYKTDEQLLSPIIHSLATHPGTGEKFIIAGLTALHDWPRTIAIDTLEIWGIEYLSQEIRVAILKAQDIAQQNLLVLRLRCLLQNKIFNLNKFISNILESE
ncbi:MAG TPA: hypothetical protein IAB06_07775 [Candidatus Avacidaminococcus intestinavium]|uniref:Uncharacterized protein n=1 Tax=Candidatus Avacidaminococcus intestinavium TaxID=2840684 RepID=A0A9D1SMB7_9FIRM|nr:hypothetical protein [Candidatus Avacidaminococcus intestinavium]